MECTGGCHCGNLQVKLRLFREPEQMAVRACTCSFCRVQCSAHDLRSSRIVRNFGGRLDDGPISQVRHAHLRLSVMRPLRSLHRGMTDADAPSPRAVVNVNCFAERTRFSDMQVSHNFDGETAGARQARHNANWMPAILRREAERACLRFR